MHATQFPLYKTLEKASESVVTDSRPMAAWGQGRGRAGLQKESEEALWVLEMAILIILMVS